MAEKDFLDEVVDERTAKNPEFPELVEAAARRRQMLSELAEKRHEYERSKTAADGDL